MFDKLIKLAFVCNGIGAIYILWNLFTDSDGNIWIGLAFLIIPWIILWILGNTKGAREEAEKESEAVADFSRNVKCEGSKLIVQKQSPLFSRYLTKAPYVITNYKAVESKLVYRSATVGGITTGGFSKEGGGYQMKDYKSNKYLLNYYNPHNIAAGATEIERIVLSDELLEKAKKNSFISKQLKGNEIIVVEDFTLSDGAVAAMSLGYNDIGMSALSSEKANVYPSEMKCDEIISFLSVTDSSQDNSGKTETIFHDK